MRCPRPNLARECVPPRHVTEFPPTCLSVRVIHVRAYDAASGLKLSNVGHVQPAATVKRRARLGPAFCTVNGVCTFPTRRPAPVGPKDNLLVYPPCSSRRRPRGASDVVQHPRVRPQCETRVRPNRFGSTTYALVRLPPLVLLFLSNLFAHSRASHSLLTSPP